MAALLLAASPLATPPPAACPVLRAWPGADWSVATPPADPAGRGAIEALERYAFPPRAADRKGIRTDGVVVARGGVIVYERYADGYGPASPHVAWSCTKSLTSALAGVALAGGALGLDDSICRHLPAAGGACEVTVRHLLQLASGLDWNESYEGMNLQGSSVLAMLYGVGRADMAGFVRAHPSIAPPGARWNYSSGDSVLLSAVIRAALEPRLGAGWPGAALFEPLGMRSATLERDAAGTPVGSSFLHATPRDLARFGLLYLADGCWRGERILAEGYVAASRSSVPFRACEAATPTPRRRWRRPTGPRMAAPASSSCAARRLTAGPGPRPAPTSPASSPTPPPAWCARGHFSCGAPGRATSVLARAAGWSSTPLAV
jgi:CubicO group peptidase (beta-lactamase class C family)